MQLELAVGCSDGTVCVSNQLQVLISLNFVDLGSVAVGCSSAAGFTVDCGRRF